MTSTYQTLSNVYSDVRFSAGKDSTTLIDSDLLRLANKYFRLMVRELIDLNEDLYAEISYTDLVSGQREYPLPVDSTTTYGGGLIKIQRVEISYDDTNWRVATPMSLQEIPGPTILDTDLNSLYSKNAPKYWFKDRSIWIAPIPGSDDYTKTGNNNLYIFWIKRPNEMTSSSDIPNIPADFLSVLTEGMLIDVFRKYGKLNDMRIAENRWVNGIARMRTLEAHPDVEQKFYFKALYKNYK